MGGVVEPPQPPPALGVDDQLADARVVGAGKGEPLDADGVGEELADHAPVHDRDDRLVRVRRHDAAQARPEPFSERLGGLGTRDHVPPLLLDDLEVERVALGGLQPECATLPVTQVHLPQLRHLGRLHAQERSQRRRRLVRAGERRHVDAVDRAARRVFRRQPCTDQTGLLVALGGERRVAVAVLQRERTVGMGVRRRTVADQEHRRRPWRWGEPALRNAVGRLLGHGSSVPRGGNVAEFTPPGPAQDAGGGPDQHHKMSWHSPNVANSVRNSWETNTQASDGPSRHHSP